MRKASVIRFAFLFVMTGQAVVVWGWQPSGVEIVPEYPTSCDVVVITLSGGWGNSCIPNASAISVEGNDIYFDVIWDYPPGIICADVITSWERTRSVGPLAPGTYTLYARLVGYPPIPEEYTLLAEFTVTAESCVPTVYYVDAVNGNDLNDGLTPGTAFATIQKGVDEAKSGDTVIVAPGIYIGEGNRDIDFYCKAIVLRSTNPSDPNVVAGTIIDCEGTYDSAFNFHSNEGPNSVLTGFTITNGYAGIRCRDYSGPTIRNCIITNNCASIFSDGISCNNSSPTIINCTVSGHSAGYGHGIATYNSSLTITNCIITENSSDHGGGIYCIGDSSLTIANCIISRNSATFYGGGIFVGGSNAVISNCIISDNVANWGGGGLSSSGSNMTITNCTFAANSSGNGNAVRCSSSHNNPSDANISNCIFWDGGDEIQNSDGSTIIVTYSDVQGTWPGLGNIDSDPCFVDAANGDYHLKSQAGRWDPNSQSWVQDEVTSSCIDAGDPDSSIGYELFPNGGRVNMGSYGGMVEASKSYFGEPVCEKNIAGDINGDCIINFVDMAFLAKHWLVDNRD